MTDTAKKRKEDLLAHLRRSILTLQMPPGDMLDEAKLSNAFGLSRTPLREAFRTLAGEGYTEIITGRGARVAEMSYATLRDFFLVAPMIYSAILRLAAENASDAQIARLKQAQHRFKNALRQGAPSERALANNQFHEITGEMANNTYLLPSFKRLLIDHARIAMTFYQPQNNQMAANLTLASEQHDQIIAAISAHDSDAAANLADAHWRLSRDQIERFVMPAALKPPFDTKLPFPI